MKALILVDIQNDFLPGGALAVPDGDAILPAVDRLMTTGGYHLIVATQDWHPTNHRSFASQHPGRNIGDVIELDGLEQVLWPDHCVQGSAGARLSESLDQSKIDGVVRKGTDHLIDSYSGFYDNGHRRATGLAELLRSEEIESLDIIGLATDYCVRFTALDAVREGFETRVLLEGCRGVDLQPDDCVRAIQQMRREGIRVINPHENE